MAPNMFELLAEDQKSVTGSTERHRVEHVATQLPPPNLRSPNRKHRSHKSTATPARTPPATVESASNQTKRHQSPATQRGNTSQSPALRSAPPTFSTGAGSSPNCGAGRGSNLSISSQRAPVARERSIASSTATLDSVHQSFVKQTPTHAAERRYAVPKLPLQPLNDEPNSEAIAAWRANKPATLQHTLPSNFDPRTPSKDSIVSRRGHAFPMIDYVAAKTCTYIVLKVSGPDHSRATAHIWGDMAAAREAVSSIDSWVRRSFMLAGDEFFPRIPSLTDEEIWQIRHEVKQAEHRDQFRRKVPEKKPFAFNVHVKLDVTGQSLTTVLGPNFEALDRIRTECLCYISYVRDSVHHPELHDTFQIVGDNEDGISQACRRLFGIVRQQDARQLDRPTWWTVKQCTNPRELVKLVAYEPGPQRTPQSVREVQCRRPAQRKVPMRPVAHGPELKEFASMKQTRAETSSEPGIAVVGDTEDGDMNIRSTEATVMTTLETLRHYKGYLRMRASLGNCVFTTYPRGAESNKLGYSLSAFQELLDDRNREENQLEGHITQELGAQLLGSSVLDRLRRSEKIIPYGSNDLAGSSVKPAYCATFVIADQSLKGVHYRLELEWQIITLDKGFEQTKKLWLRLEQHGTTLVPLMNINIVDLQGGLSHHLGISAGHAVDDARIPEHWHEFANDVKLLPDKQSDPSQPNVFVHLPHRGNGMAAIPIVSMEQKRAWRFTFLTSDYVVEVAALQSLAWAKETKQPTASDTKWSLNMWHAQWDTWLTSNARLGLGEQARWKAEEWVFFPAESEQSSRRTVGQNGVQSKPDLNVKSEDQADLEAERALFRAGSGIRTLLQKMSCLEDIIMGKEEQDKRLALQTPLQASGSASQDGDSFSDY